MSMIWGTVRRGSIALAGTFLALNVTGSSATAMVGGNSASATAVESSTLVSGSVGQHALVEPSETVRWCPRGLQYAFRQDTCDPVSLVDE